MHARESNSSVFLLENDIATTWIHSCKNIVWLEPVIDRFMGRNLAERISVFGTREDCTSQVFAHAERAGFKKTNLFANSGIATALSISNYRLF